MLKSLHPSTHYPKELSKAVAESNVILTICSTVERKVGVYKEIVEGDNNL